MPWLHWRTTCRIESRTSVSPLAAWRPGDQLEGWFLASPMRHFPRQQSTLANRHVAGNGLDPEGEPSRSFESCTQHHAMQACVASHRERSARKSPPARRVSTTARWQSPPLTRRGRLGAGGGGRPRGQEAIKQLTDERDASYPSDVVLARLDGDRRRATQRSRRGDGDVLDREGERSGLHLAGAAFSGLRWCRGDSHQSKRSTCTGPVCVPAARTPGASNPHGPSGNDRSRNRPSQRSRFRSRPLSASAAAISGSERELGGERTCPAA